MPRPRSPRNTRKRGAGFTAFLCSLEPLVVLAVILDIPQSRAWAAAVNAGISALIPHLPRRS